MALTNIDLEKIGKVVRSNINEALEEVIFPKFDELEGKVEGLREDVSKLQEDVSRLEKKTDKIAEVLTEVKVNHERRIRKLEDEAGIEPIARLNY